MGSAVGVGVGIGEGVAVGRGVALGAVVSFGVLVSSAVFVAGGVLLGDGAAGGMADNCAGAPRQAPSTIPAKSKTIYRCMKANSNCA